MKTFKTLLLFNCTTGILVTTMNDIYSIMNEVTGKSLMTTDLSPNAPTVKAELFNQLPQLKEPSDVFRKWAIEQRKLWETKDKEMVLTEMAEKVEQLIKEYSLESEYSVETMNSSIQVL